MSGDLIRREDAIKILKHHLDEDYLDGYVYLNELEALPSAEPEPEEFEWCHDCKEYDQEKHCCHRWTKVIRQTVEEMKSAEPERKKGEWIPFTMRELTDEEREENPEWDWVFTCKLPADGETVLLTNGKYVWEDMFCCDDGCHFDKADDIEDYDGYAWMPLPEPYEREK